MFKKQVLPFLVVALLMGVFWGLQSAAKNSITNSETAQQQKILQLVAEAIKELHYSPKAINDSFSIEVFKEYLSNIDPQKEFLLEADIKQLDVLKNYLDNELNGETIKFLPAVTKILNSRIEKAIQSHKNIFSKPFDFSEMDSIYLDSDKKDFPEDSLSQYQWWYKKAKFLVLEKFVDLQKIQENSKKQKTFIVKSDTQLEAEARKKVLNSLLKTFERIKRVVNSKANYSLYVKAVTNVMDPHTIYFAPVEKRSFDEQMSAKFYGIGAQLREEEGYIKIAKLLTGLPAWKSKEINIGDIILKVAEGNKEPVDIVGFSTLDAVKLIRGNLGEVVKLTIKKTDGIIKVVSLIRAKVEQDETLARSAIIEEEKKIGYIQLSEFYADFGHPDGAHSARDVAAQVEKLKKQHIQGLLIDLRNNGGGSLEEVRKMVGLFVSGPVVQVRNKRGGVEVLESKSNVIYDGPLVVLVNEFTASASEIFAGAIQDFKRGIVIGSSSTFGKGTVQKSISLGNGTTAEGQQYDFGAMNITCQKFYRINGKSTQIKGVQSSILLPDFYEFSKVRERDEHFALIWDEIAPAKGFYEYPTGFLLDQLDSGFQNTVDTTKVFSSIKNNTKWLARQNERPYRLNLKAYKEELKQIKSITKQDEQIINVVPQLNIQPLYSNMDTLKISDIDREKTERYKAWVSSLKKDMYIRQANKIAVAIGKAYEDFTLNRSKQAN